VSRRLRVYMENDVVDYLIVMSMNDGCVLSSCANLKSSPHVIPRAVTT